MFCSNILHCSVTCFTNLCFIVLYCIVMKFGVRFKYCIQQEPTEYNKVPVFMSVPFQLPIMSPTRDENCSSNKIRKA